MKSKELDVVTGRWIVFWGSVITLDLWIGSGVFTLAALLQMGNITNSIYK